MDISTLKLPDWVLWVAQDEDGAWWGYEVEPLQHDKGWYENEVGRRVKIELTKTGSGIENSDWRSSLRKFVK